MIYFCIFHEKFFKGGSDLLLTSNEGYSPFALSDSPEKMLKSFPSLSDFVNILENVNKY